jgi:cytoskeletal protein CcmA (bactofilin family)
MFNQKSKKTESNSQISAPMASSESTTCADVESPALAGANEAENVICKGTTIFGNIVAEGDLVIEGIVRGDVETKATLFLGPSCVIEGNILAENAEVAGQVKGTVKATGLLVIKSSSMIDGDVLTKNLNVESGSTFNGKFTVGSVTSTPIPKKAESTIKAEAPIGNPVRQPVAGLSSVPTKV